MFSLFRSSRGSSSVIFDRLTLNVDVHVASDGSQDKIDKIIYLMSKLHRGWSPSPPSQRLMIKVFDNINYNTIWIQKKANIVNILLVKIGNSVYL